MSKKTPHITQIDPTISALIIVVGFAWISIGFIFPQFGQTIIGQIWMVLGTIPILLGIWKINRIEVHTDYMIKRDCCLLRKRIIYFSNVVQVKITPTHLSSQPNFSIFYYLLKTLGFHQRYFQFRVLSIRQKGKMPVIIDERTMPKRDFDFIKRKLNQ